MLQAKSECRPHMIVILYRPANVLTTIYDYSTLGNNIDSGSGVYMRTHIVHGKPLFFDKEHGKPQVIDMVTLILLSGTMLLCCLKSQMNLCMHLDELPVVFKVYDKGG